MGRFAKNQEIKTGSYAARLPIGTTDLGSGFNSTQVTPQFPVMGQIKFNKDINKLEVYYNSKWHEISSSSNGRVNIVKDTFDGTGVETVFYMTNSIKYAPGDEAMVLVFVGNIFQNPGEVYTFGIDGFSINFTEAPPLGSKVLVLHNFNSTHTTN
jgi:hypothetical protein